MTEPALKNEIEASTPAAPEAAPAETSSPFFDEEPGIVCACVSDVGRVREGNQDSFLITKLVTPVVEAEVKQSQVRRRSIDPEGHLLVVADGMGGHLGGERASALAVQTVEQSLRASIPSHGEVDEEVILSALREALRDADHAVWSEGQNNADLRGMGTTLTIAFTLGSDLYLAHVGDSRCYQLRAGRLEQLTQDHTVFGDLVRRGALRPDAAAGHYFRHILTAAIGTGNASARAEVRKVSLRRGDVLMLCSDGLYEMVYEDEIETILRKERVPEEASSGLVALANHHGGRDNVTALVARFS